MALYRRISTADVNAANIKATTARLVYLHAANNTASAKFVKLYDKATAPTVGTDVPTFTFVLPANFSGVLVPPSPDAPLTFLAGLGVGITGALADADMTPVALGDVVLNGRFE